MEKIKFALLFLCVMGLGFYVGSREGGYANHFFSDSNSRIPANADVINVNDIFKKGQLRTSIRGDFKTYSFLENPEANICTVFPDVKSFELSMTSDAATSGEPSLMFVNIDCSVNGGSPFFMKSFCSADIRFFVKSYTYENTRFGFSGIIDGFPKEWYIESLNAKFIDGLDLGGIKPLPSEIEAFGKFTINCESF